MENLFATYVQAGVFGSIIILLILLLRLILRKAPRQLMCILWLLAAVRLLMPFHMESMLSLQPVLPQTDGTVIQQPEYTPDDSPVIPDAGVGEMPAPDDPGQGDIPADIPQDDMQSGAQITKDPVNYKQVLSVVWVSAAGALLVYTAISYVHLRHKVRLSVKCGNGIMECGRIRGAFVLGYFRPRIYLPAVVEQQDRVHIIAHEQAHIARGDNWWKLLGFLCVSLHWYNPLVWLGYALFCRDTEVACDERVVWKMDLQERKAYSLALLNCGKHISGLSAVTLCFGKVSLGQRIKNVLSYRKPGLWITAAAGMLVVLVAICFLTTPQTQAREIPEPSETQQPTEGPTETPTEAPTQPPTEPPTQPPTQPPTGIASGTCGQGVTWSLSSSGVLTISGTGAMADYSNEAAQPWDAYRETVTQLAISEGVTQIGEYAFAGCTAVRSVTIPASVTQISRYAFGRCTGLSTLTFAPGSRIHIIGRVAFANTAITEFIAPGSLRIIGRQAFMECHALQNVVLAGGVQTVETWAFKSCIGMKTLVIGQSVTQIDALTAFEGCDAIERMEIYTDAAMRVCYQKPQMRELVLGGSVVSVYSMYGCDMLTRITVSAPSITFLEGSVNSAVREIVFLSDVSTFRKDAFAGAEFTAYYPAGNPTWTEDKLQDYGGKVTWVAVE